MGRWALTARRGATHIHVKHVADGSGFTAPHRAVVIDYRAPESPDACEWHERCDAACREVIALAELSDGDGDDDLPALAVNLPAP